MTAEEYLDNPLPLFDDDSPETSRPATTEHLWEPALERLLRPNRSGLLLLNCWRLLSRSAPRLSAERLRAIVRDTSLPRHVRARVAHVLVHRKDAREQWNALENELEPADHSLALEGLFEYELELLFNGIRTPQELSETLYGEFPPENFEQISPHFERIRRHIGIAPSLAYDSMFEHEAARPLLEQGAEALAREGTVEALAVLDMAVLAGKMDSGIIEAARQRILETTRDFRSRPLPDGEAYVQPTRDGMTGDIIVHEGGTRRHCIFELELGKPLQLSAMPPIPAHLSAGLSAQMFAQTPDMAAPFREVMAELGRSARVGVDTGNMDGHGEVVALLKRWPEPEPIAPGEPFTDDELSALFNDGPFSDWRLPMEAAGEAIALVKYGADEPIEEAEWLEAVSHRAALAARILRWSGEPELAARLMGHVGTTPDRRPHLVRLTTVWAAHEARRLFKTDAA